MEKNEVKKYLYRNKELMAKYLKYNHGSLFYTVEIENIVYMFPVKTMDTKWIVNPEDPEGDKIEIIIGFSADLGLTDFDRDIKASFLNRWIDIAIDKGEFIKLFV